eukprot:Colp12_sorted_trinity150504_noHs@4119
MACCMSPEEKESRRKNDEIERMLKKDRTTLKREVKLLLLGAGESGKSTIVKQMRIIHGEGYSDKELSDFKSVIFQNIVKSAQTLAQAMDKLQIQYSDSETKKAAEALLSVECNMLTAFTPDLHQNCLKLWGDKGIEECYNRRREFQLNDSAKYYFENLNRIAQSEYIPTQQDVLRSRVATTGIVETKFFISNVSFRMVDVGGQRSERRKWIHCFECVTSIIFIVALSEYDQVLYEDENQNRMRESMALFDNIINYKWFEDTSIILFLNKTDIFSEKIVVSPLSKYFPNFPGPDGNIDSAKEFILDMFVKLNRNESKPLYPHFTCATDTENIRFVSIAVKDTILQHNLRDYGLM